MGSVVYGECLPFFFLFSLFFSFSFLFFDVGDQTVIHSMARILSRHYIHKQLVFLLRAIVQ